MEKRQTASELELSQATPRAKDDSPRHYPEVMTVPDKEAMQLVKSLLIQFRYTLEELKER